MINHKLITAILIPMLLIPMASFGYAHWTGSVAKQVKLHYRCVEAEIKSYKLLSPWNDKLIDKWPSDDELEDMHGTNTIIFSTHIFPGWYVWIGFIIQNQGMFPVWIDEPTYEVSDPNNIWDWFIHDEYYYGQIIDGTSYGWPRSDVPKGLYEHVFVQSANQKDKGKPLPLNAVDPPPEGNVPPPIYLEPAGATGGEHHIDSMIMWIFLQLPKEYEDEDPFWIEISISLTVTMAAP